MPSPTRETARPVAAWPGHWLHWVLLVALAAALSAPYRRFTTDDAFIHFQFARNLANGRGFSYNSDEPTYGDTSPLWVFMLAGTGRLLAATGRAPAGPVASPDTAL